MRLRIKDWVGRRVWVKVWVKVKGKVKVWVKGRVRVGAAWTRSPAFTDKGPWVGMLGARVGALWPPERRWGSTGGHPVHGPPPKGHWPLLLRARQRQAGQG